MLLILIRFQIRFYKHNIFEWKIDRYFAKIEKVII